MQERTVKVWDLGVRTFHWSLVMLFVIAYLTGDEESDVHVVSGYAIGALLVFRLVWGFIGGRYARFSQFVTGPAEVRRYLTSLIQGSPKHYLGHNPAGGWMVILLLVSLSAAVLSGLYAENEFWEEVHEFFASVTVLLVAIHILGVLVASLLHGENLVRAMITGEKREPE